MTTFVLLTIYVAGVALAYFMGRGSGRAGYRVTEQPKSLFIFPPFASGKPGYVLVKENGRVIQVTHDENKLAYAELSPKKPLPEWKGSGLVELKKDEDGNIIGAKITPAGQAALRDHELDLQGRADADDS